MNFKFVKKRIYCVTIASHPFFVDSSKKCKIERARIVEIEQKMRFARTHVCSQCARKPFNGIVVVFCEHFEADEVNENRSSIIIICFEFIKKLCIDG